MCVGGGTNVPPKLSKFFATVRFFIYIFQNPEKLSPQINEKYPPIPQITYKKMNDNKITYKKNKNYNKILTKILYF
jgi:hypothetical protein